MKNLTFTFAILLCMLQSTNIFAQKSSEDLNVISIEGVAISSCDQEEIKSLLSSTKEGFYLTNVRLGDFVKTYNSIPLASVEVLYESGLVESQFQNAFSETEVVHETIWKHKDSAINEIDKRLFQVLEKYGIQH